MTVYEFDLAMDRITQVFPKTQYTEERRKLIFKATSSLPASNFNRIVDHFVASSRQAPLPKDFLEAAARERMYIGHPEDRREHVAPIACEWCCDGGIMEIEGRSSGKEYFIRCGCDVGRFSFRKELPRWSSKVFGERFIPLKMSGERALRWKPKKPFNPKDPHNSLTDMLEIWQLKLRVSIAFWNDYLKDPDDDGAA